MNNVTTPRDAILMRSATIASVSVAAGLILIKLVAYILSGSVALLASLIDSLIDLVASIVNLFAVRHALEPADQEHRFGHGKAEPLAGMIQGAFIAGSSMFLFFEAGFRLLNPHHIAHANISIAVMVISLVLTIMLVIFQQYVVKQTSSVAIKADSIHYLSDILQNVGVILALILSTRFNLTMADPLIALIIGTYILYSAWQIVRQSFDQLMDRELSDEDRERIRTIALSHPSVKDLHELRTRHSGRDIFIQLHLEMDGNLTLYKAHEVADSVEESIREVFPNADVIIHEDPEGIFERRQPV
jgi:ferrous-iron efflux pump FieF